MKVIIQTGLTEAQETAQFDFMGNLPFLWVGQADTLIAAADVLRSSGKPDLLFPELMMRGFAIENLLKALWLVRGNTLFENGKMQDLPVFKKHDLLAMANQLKVSLSEGEKSLLRRLSMIAVSVGRYPSPINLAHVQGKKQHGGRTVEIFWEYGDNETLKKFDEGLRQEIGLKIERSN